MRRLVAVMAIALAATGAVACGGGEDRPGQVTSESGGSGSASGSATGSGSGSESGSGSASGTHSGEHGSLEPADFDEGEADAVVRAQLVNYAFRGIPASVKGPHVFFEATNASGTEHELVVKKGDEELIEIEAFTEGERTLAVELEPGEYSIVCLVEEGAKTHEELGMKAPLTVVA